MNTSLLSEQRQYWMLGLFEVTNAIKRLVFAEVQHSELERWNIVRHNTLQHEQNAISSFTYILEFKIKKCLLYIFVRGLV